MMTMNYPNGGSSNGNQQLPINGNTNNNNVIHHTNNHNQNITNTQNHNIPLQSQSAASFQSVEQLQHLQHLQHLQQLQQLQQHQQQHPHGQPHQSPVLYNGVNPNYPGVRRIHQNPPVFCVDNFLTLHECQFLIQAASDSFTPAPVVGKGAGEISASRTSSTCYLAREDVPDLMRKVSLLTGKPVEHCELPQVGRYLSSQQYVQHFDAFNLDEEDGLRFAANGGQRTVTVLVYLNDVQQGGATRFPNLNMQVQPKQGMALVFFPATVGGVLDQQVLHAALPAVDLKYVSQIWIRQGAYFGQPSKRLSQTLGVPFGMESHVQSHSHVVPATNP